jgi:DNA-binding winged helix-turn-helix (wHTH) protein
MTGIRFDVLGPLCVRHGDELLPLTGHKYRAVISCLALHPEERMSVDALLKAAWGDPAPRSAVHQVRKMISTLRLSLDGGWGLISTLQDGYLLRATAEHSDLARFTKLYGRAMSSALATDEELTYAYDVLALWRGKPCEGSTPRGHEDRIAQLIEQHRALLLKTLKAFSDRGREDELVAILQVAARIHGESVPSTDANGIDPLPGDRPVAASMSPAASGPAGAAPERSPGSRCLPRDLRDFSGRSYEVSALETFLQSRRRGPFVATIHGMGGVGKTALAVHVAHRIAHQFPDGQLYVSLDGVSSAATHTVRNTLGTLLRQLGVPDDEIPSSEESRLARWRNLTSGRRLLIVLDDAAGLAQVEPLMPASAQSACIITSRVVLSGMDGAFYLRLEVPDENQCLDLLRHIVGEALVDEDPEAARSLVRMFENLPLALRLAAARLSTREFVSVTELAHSLHASPSPVRELELPGRSVIGRLDTSLTTMEGFDYDRYLRLTLLPAPELDEITVSVALGLSAEQARRMCRRFTDRALLKRVAVGAYKMHPLLAQAARVHVQATISVEEQRSIVGEALRHYRNAMGLIGSARVSPSPGPSAALLFGTLVRAAELAQSLGLQNEFADLCLAWERPVNLYLDTDQQQQVWDLALTAAREHPQASTRGNILLALSRCLWHRNAVAEGTAATRQAWEEGERADDHLLRVRSLLRSSAFCWLAQDVESGLGYLEQAKSHLKDCHRQCGELETRREALEILSNEAALLVQRGDFATAEQLSLRVMDSPDLDPRVTIMATVTYAASLVGLQKYGEALAAATAALQEANRIRSAYGRALALQQTADTLRSLPRPEAHTAATDAAEKGRNAARETGSIRIVQELDQLLDELATRPSRAG